MRKSSDVTDKELFNSIYHWKFENDMSWEFCSGILKQNYDIDISSATLRRRILKYIESKKIIKTWQEKLEDEKEQRQSKGIER